MSKLPKMNPKARGRSWLFGPTNGKCFYCGDPTYNHGFPQTRDWLFIRVGSRAIREHKTPTIRGGRDERDNFVLSCGACNSRKGAYTLEEYRFVCGLSSRSFPFRFHGEEPARNRRDWMICCTEGGAQRALLLHNMPDAVHGIPRVRPRSYGGLVGRP